LDEKKFVIIEKKPPVDGLAYGSLPSFDSSAKPTASG